SLLEDDPQSPYFDTIPLAWTSGQRATPQQIAPWLAHPLPAIRLLGASYGLAGGDRQQAIGVLDSLAQQPDARVRHLATAQRWRTRLARPDPQELDRWPAVIAQLPRTQ
ncbi:MAG: hypothetical protein GTO03_09060, partial [Planctomycetales bacterium]|nr:hypothetical protein [Planctomycetales bacterium]